MLSAQKWQVKQLSTFFEVTDQSILQWFNRFEAEGIEGLRIRPGRGRKRKLDIDNEDHVKAVKVGLGGRKKIIYPETGNILMSHFGKAGLRIKKSSSSLKSLREMGSGLQ